MDIQSKQTINSVMAVKVIRFAEYSAAIKREIALSTVITGQSNRTPPTSSAVTSHVPHVTQRIRELVVIMMDKKG